MLKKFVNVEAPLPGMVSKIRVKEGDTVSPGDVMLILEAMKMQNEIMSDVKGTISEIKCSEDTFVEAGEPLVIIQEDT